MTSGKSRVCLFFLIINICFCNIAYLNNRNQRELPRKRCSCGPVVKCGLKIKMKFFNAHLIHTYLETTEFFLTKTWKITNGKVQTQSLNTYEKLLNTREEIEKKILAIYIPKNSRFQRKKMSLRIFITTCLLCSNISSCC